MAYRSQFIDEKLIIQAKRFTDAELAAELHCQREAWAQALYDDVYSRYVEEERSLTNSRERLEMGNKAVVLHRFATLPHYDEAALSRRLSGTGSWTCTGPPPTP